MSTKAWILKERPSGMVTEDLFKLSEVKAPTPEDLKEGEVIVKLVFVSVDPYMRGRLNDVKSYIPPWELEKSPDGGCIGTVTHSKFAGLQAGDNVTGFLRWQLEQIASGAALKKLPGNEAKSEFVGMLGTTGLSAYLPLKHIGKPKKGDVVFVSGAAGAVGSAVGQLCKHVFGCKVFGSAGTDDKVQFILNECGFDGAFNYRNETYEAAVKRLCPDGVDVYFDNVGGEALDALLVAMKPFGRIVACGSISQYNNKGDAYGVKNLFAVIGKRLLMQGFIVTDYEKEFPQAVQELAEFMAQGKIKSRETVLQGFEKIPAGFVGLFKGDNIGKMVIDARL
eukprot:GDKH01004026.1.p1 GENE.GDKH01004026.1~~GDKH01004026.1.p1  ORF type:complete len:337 (-),score=77.90 GDKH01004026.1:253-1263(-)